MKNEELIKKIHEQIKPKKKDTQNLEEYKPPSPSTIKPETPANISPMRHISNEI